MPLLTSTPTPMLRTPKSCLISSRMPTASICAVLCCAVLYSTLLYSTACVEVVDIHRLWCRHGICHMTNSVHVAYFCHLYRNHPDTKSRHSRTGISWTNYGMPGSICRTFLHLCLKKRRTISPVEGEWHYDFALIRSCAVLNCTVLHCTSYAEFYQLSDLMQSLVITHSEWSMRLRWRPSLLLRGT